LINETRTSIMEINDKVTNTKTRVIIRK